MNHNSKNLHEKQKRRKRRTNLDIADLMEKNPVNESSLYVVPVTFQATNDIPEFIDDFEQSLYAPEILNGFKVSEIPNHKLVLKEDVPVMLLRNIDQSNGLCNGTRLKVTKLGKHVIEAEVISSNNIGYKTYIPRMKLIPSDKRIPFKFQRRQFSVVVSFAMTINKSQGQSLSTVGLYLQRIVFTHEQLYVAISRVKSEKGLKVLICDKEGKTNNTTTNMVYKEVLQKINQDR